VRGVSPVFQAFFWCLFEKIKRRDPNCLSVETYVAQGGIPSPDLSPQGWGEELERTTERRQHSGRHSFPMDQDEWSNERYTPFLDGSESLFFWEVNR
jgi:hypothetical protein